MWVATGSLSNDFAMNTVFLGCEFQSHECGGQELGRVRGVRRKAEVTEEKFSISQREGVAVFARTRIFAGSEQEKERQADHIGDGLVGHIVGCDRQGHDVA